MTSAGDKPEEPPPAPPVRPPTPPPSSIIWGGSSLPAAQPPAQSPAVPDRWAPPPPPRPPLSAWASDEPVGPATRPHHGPGRQNVARQPEYYGPPDRPGTVTAAAVILFVSAGFAVLACCGIAALAGGADLDSSASNAVTLLAVVLAVSAGLNVWLGYHLLQGRPWARITTIVLCGISILSTVVTFAATARGEGDIQLGSCVGIGLNVTVIGLLLGTTASDYFRAMRDH